MADELLSTLDEPGSPTLHRTVAGDGYVWHYRRFPATGMIRSRLVFLHGIQSHGGWYPRSCARLAAAGHEVYFLERRGCGRNTASRGDIPSFRRCLDDIGEFLVKLPTDRKRFLGAISWGGKLGVGLQYRHPGLVDGLMLLCPGLFPKVTAPFFQRLWIGRCALRNPTKLFPIPLNDPALFTESEPWRKFLREDPLSLHEATARMLFQSTMFDFYLRRARKRVAVPTLLMLAEQDRIIIKAKTRRYVDRMPAKSKTVIEYPGAHHTLEFEPDDHPFVGDMLNWLNPQIS